MAAVAALLRVPMQIGAQLSRYSGTTMQFAHLLRIGLALSLLISATVGRTATFCVDSPTELTTAFNAAGSNNEDDVVRIKTGTYATSAGSNAFHYATNQSFAITVQGGWEAFLQFDCFRRIDDPTATILSGSNVRRALQMSGNPGTSGTMVIENLTLRDGHAVEHGGGLRQQGGGAGFTGNVRVERVYFRNNVSESLGGGASIASEGIVELRNNLFFGNHADTDHGAAVITALFASASSVRNFIGNNTVVANTCGAGGNCQTGGFLVFGTARASVYSNAFFANDGNDVQFGGASADLLFNNIHQFFGTPVNNIGNIDVADPLFANVLALDFRLRFESPLRNAGFPGTDPGEVDFAGAPRINDDRIDIGAFENSEVLFKNSFQTLQ